MRISGVAADIQRLDPGTIIDLFELDATSLGGDKLLFHAGVSELGNDVVWQGTPYVRLPIEMEGFEMRSTGVAPRPTLRAANVGGLLGRVAYLCDDLVCAKITRKRTFLRYLDAVNFARNNYLQWSEDFANSVWLKYRVNVASGFADAVGGMSAWALTEDTTSANSHYLDQRPFIGSIGSNAFYFAVDMKANGRNTARLYFFSSPTTASYAAGTVDLNNKAFSSAWALAGAILHDSGAVDLGNGWARYWIVASFNTETDTGIYWRVRMENNAGATTYDGDGVSGVLIARPQAAISATPIPYQETGLTQNPTADPTVCFDDEVYYVDRKVNENRLMIEWELVSAMDLAGVKLPKRQIIANLCPWRYRGGECNYTGGPVAEGNGAYTSDPAKDACGKRLSDCRLRFTGTQVVRFGGYPAAGLTTS